MNVFFEGLGYLEVSDGLPRVVDWDPTLPHAERNISVNRGCPNGYAAEFVPDEGGGTVTVCRRMDQAYMTDPSIRNAETSLPWGAYLFQVVGGSLADPSTYTGFFTTGLPEVLEYAARLAGRTAGSLLSPVAASLQGILIPVLIVLALIWFWPERKPS